MKVHLRPVDLASLEYVCLHLRDQDKREIYSMRPHDNPLLLAWETHSIVKEDSRSVIAWHEGRPAAFMGFCHSWPMVWEAIAYGTDAWRSVAIDLMRWARLQARDVIQSGQGHRLQATSHIAHTDAHRFMKALGAVQEGPPKRNWGKDGSAYLTFAWIKGENDHVLFKQVEKQQHTEAGTGGPEAGLRSADGYRSKANGAGGHQHHADTAGGAGGAG